PLLAHRRSGALAPAGERNDADPCPVSRAPAAAAPHLLLAWPEHPLRLARPRGDRRLSLGLPVDGSAGDELRAVRDPGSHPRGELERPRLVPRGRGACLLAAPGDRFIAAPSSVREVSRGTRTFPRFGRAGGCATASRSSRSWTRRPTSDP